MFAPMRTRMGAVIMVLALVLAAVAAAATHLTATALRIGDHAGFVRVVVDLTGGKAKLGEVLFADRLFKAGKLFPTLSHHGVRTTAAPRSGAGVSARVGSSGGGNVLLFSFTAAKRRFKGVEESALHSPERLVFDLWKAAPPTAAATVRSDGCLAIDGFTVSSGRVSAHGRELQLLFEDTFSVQVRGSSGAVLGRKTVTTPVGPWQRSVGYNVAKRQRGTLEAWVLSARDGSIDCLAQVPVTLQP